MGSSMGKTTLREIRQSLGRYFAIMAIVALGVGLFSGLKVTRDVMVSSAQLYFDQTSFYDVELISTVGFETDAARQLSRREGVLDAQGSVSTDALLVDESGNENALQVMQLLDEQNQPVLVSGRLPQSAQECVVDALAFGEDSIGATLTLSDNNDDDTDEMFAQKTFRIVGRVNSPVYANYERGTTSLGNGTIDGFMLVLRDAFDCDYDTEIYVRLNTFGAQIYTDGYDNQIDEAEEWLEDFAQEQADERYSRLKSEAERDLFEGREQLTAQTQSGELELIASKDQLDSAKVEIDSGYAQLESGRTELQSGKAQLESQRQSLQSQKTELLLQKQQVLSGLNEVAAAKAQTAGTAYYSQSVAQEQQLQASLSQIESGLAEIESGLAQIEQQSQELALQEQQLQASQTELEAAQREYRDGLAQYEQGMQELSQSTSDAQDELDDAQDEIDDLEEPDVYVLTRDENIGYASFDNDSSIVDAIANVFPIFFFLVAALVCMTTMNRMVEEQRTQIGVLKALGYSEGTIMGTYLFYSGSAAGIGCLIGFFGGSLLFPFVIWRTYAIMYTMGDIVFVFDYSLGLISLLALDALLDGLHLLHLPVRAAQRPRRADAPQGPQERQAHPAGAHPDLVEPLLLFGQGLDPQRAAV